MGHFVQRVLPRSEYGPRAVRRDREYLAYVPDDIADADYAPSRDAALRIAEAAEQVTAFTLKASGSPARATRVIGLLSRSEGIGSSTIENYSSPLAKVIAADATGERPHNTTTPVVILDGIDSVTFAVRTLGDPRVDITPAAIEAVQQKLMAHGPLDHLGFRTGYVQVGGRAGEPGSADLVPPPAEEVPRLIQDLCAFINRTDEAIHPVARAAIAHAQFETIHPFPDGNGRVGRSLIQAMLHRDGMLGSTVLPISLAIARDDNSKAMYVDALQSWRVEGRTPSFDHAVEAFSWFASDASALAMRMIADADKAYDGMLAKTRAAMRSDSHGAAIVDLLSVRLGATVNSIVSELSADANAVRRTLKVLENNGVISSRSGGKFGRIYYAFPLLEVIEEAASMPPLLDHASPLPLPTESDDLSVITSGPGRGRPRRGERCGAPLRTGGTCMRPSGHGPTGHRSRP